MAPSSERRFIITQTNSPYLHEAAERGHIKEDLDYQDLKRKAQKSSANPKSAQQVEDENREKLAKMIMQAEIDNEQARENYAATKKTAKLANRLLYYSPVVGAINIPFGLFGFWAGMVTITVAAIAMIAGGIHLRPAEVRSDRMLEIDTRHKLNYLYGVKIAEYPNDKQLTSGS